MTDPITTRRLSPTPAWLIFGLLVVEGLLWLSERYTWFSFNEKKGWTVLIGVAVVGVMMLVMLLWFVVALVFRWRFQFSIRSLFGLTVAVAVLCSWLAMERRRANKQWEVVQEFVKCGGGVGYDYEYDAYRQYFIANRQPPEPRWLRNLLGDDFFSHIVWVDVSGPQVTDQEVAHLEDLPRLGGLNLFETQVTDAGLGHLKALPHLRLLRVSHTPVTDAGLEYLKGLTQLRSLDLGGTQVTDAGVQKLQQALPNCRISH